MTPEEETEDMAAVGRSLMDSIDTLVRGDARFKHWAPAQDPAEIVFDIVNMMDDAQTEILGVLKRYWEIWSESLIDPTLGEEARAVIEKYSPEPDGKAKPARIQDITDTKDLAKAARDFVARNPVENVPEKLLLHMAAEIEVLRKERDAGNRRANAFRRKISRL